MPLATLHPSRQASANAPTTGESLSVVVRNYAPLPTTHVIPAPALVDLEAEQYRAAVVLPGTRESFLVWAKTSGSFRPGLGNTLVMGFTPLPIEILIQDQKNRDVVMLLSLRVQRGDTGEIFELAPGGVLRGGIFRITSPLLLGDLGGGLFESRGDRLVSSSYQVAAATFWWSKNDEYLTRYLWDGRLGRWRPRRGAAPQNLGPLSASRVELGALPSWLRVGDVLPGSTSNFGTRAFLRIASPNESGRPIAEPPLDGFGGVEVVEDVTTFSFAGSTRAGVVDLAGVLAWNPSFVEAFSGVAVWFNGSELLDSGGVLGVIEGDLYASPPPSPLEVPLLRLGSRRWLEVQVVFTESELLSLSLSAGQVGVARSTGKLRLSQADLENPALAGEVVVYDGLALGPSSLRAEVWLTSQVGAPAVVGEPLFLPRASLLTSGLLWTLDGTGRTPKTGAVSTRPKTTGLVQAVEGAWSMGLFCDKGAIPTLKVVQTIEEVPRFAFQIPRGTAYVVLLTGQVVLSSQDTQQFAGETLFFRQTVLTPTLDLPDVRIWSRRRYWFSLLGTEILVLAIGGVIRTWRAADDNGGIITSQGGTFSAEEMRQSLAALLVGVGTCTVQDGHLGIGPPLTDGSYFGQVEIGLGPAGDIDLSGPAAFGFLPGWRVQRSFNPFEDMLTLPDHGAGIGLFPASDGAADVLSEVRVEELVLASPLPSNPLVLLEQAPLQDVAGYGQNIFFRLQQGQARSLLFPLVQVFYQFDQNRFAFLEVVDETVVEDVASTSMVLRGPTTRRLLTAPGSSIEIAVPGEDFQVQAYGEDFRLAQDPGNVLLWTRSYGARVLQSSTGNLSGASLTDPYQTFEGITPGMHVDVQGRVYVIASVPSPGELVTTLPFLGEGSASYEIHEAQTEGILLERQYQAFTPLPEEPFRLRKLSPVGRVPASTSAQINEPLTTDVVVSSIRFGREFGSSEASIHVLARRALGVIENPDPLPENAHTTLDAFHLELDAEAYSFSTNTLVRVPEPTPGLVGNVIEVLPDGRLNPGTGVLAAHTQAQVVWAEDFLDANDLPSGQAERDGTTLRLSTADIVAHAGIPAFVVSRLTPNVDVTISPIQGSILLSDPLLPFQLVEAEYFRAVEGSGELLLEDGEPVRVVEFLSVFAQEVASPLPGEGTKWAFNTTARTVDGEPDVRVGSIQCNIGNSLRVGFVPQSSLTFREPVSPLATVLVTYRVLDAFGGETAMTVSRPPVWRPPFRLLAGTQSFIVSGDRTSEFLPGKLLRVGSQVFYLVSAMLEGEDTRVVFFPPTVVEAGSANPSSDVLSLLSDLSIRDTPDLWAAVDSTYEPVSRGATALRFSSQVSVPVGSILEIGGYPFVVTSSEGSEVGLGGFLPRGFASGEDAVRITTRPIYPQNPTLLFGTGPLDPETPPEVLVFPIGGTGDILTEGLDYTVEPSSGNIQLVEPLPLRALVYVRRTELRTLTPVARGEVKIFPRVRLRYGAIVAPTSTNASLLATFTFRNPDSFFYQVEPLEEAVGRVAVQLTATTGITSGPFTGGRATNFSNIGVLGPKGEVRELGLQDQATRQLIATFDGLIVPFEQVLETIDGRVIGDRDAKFQFELGRTEGIAGPGEEDPITGLLVPRVVFGEIFSTYRPDIFLLQTDPIVDPTDAAFDGVRLEGGFPDPALLSAWVDMQRPLIANDMDDVVLLGRTRKRLRGQPLRREAFGVYRRMGEAHAMSRLFPERTRAFTQTDPGLGADLEADPADPGVYAFRKRIDRPQFENGTLKFPKRASTWGTAIAQVENPVLGQITGISAMSLGPRLPRAHVIRYSSSGFPDLDTLMSSAGQATFASQPRPAVILSVVPISQFPLDAQGLPAVNLLASGGGVIADLTTGLPELFTPPWFSMSPNIYPKVALGKPDGTISNLSSDQADSYTFSGQAFTVPASVFVEAVVAGCIVTFADQNGSVPVLLDEGTQEPAILELGDTLLVVPPDARVLSNPDDPVTQEQRDALVQGIPGFRLGFDVRLDAQEGEIEDITLPSFFDPSLFGLKEVLGQRPPVPLQMVEGQVRFRNTRVDPLQVPALSGQYLDDSGDEAVPYLYTSPTELGLLGEAQKALDNIIDPDFTAPGVVAPLYPDEVLGTDGVLVPLPPATLLTAQDTTPVTTAVVYQPHSGVGDVQGFDLLLVEVGQSSLPGSSQGFLSIGRTIGSASGSTVEPPRFVAPTPLGSRVRYVFRSALAFVNQSELLIPPGLVVSRNGNITSFDLTSISNGLVVWNNGSNASVGGINDIINPTGFPYPNGDNILFVRLWTAARPGFPPTFIQTVTVRVNGGVAFVQGDAGVQPLLAQPLANNEIWSFNTPGPFVTIAPVPGPGQIPEDLTNPGQSVPLWFTVDVDTTGLNNPLSSAGSYTARIEPDRLTFSESLDLRSVLPRDEPAVDGVPVASSLDVVWVEGETGAVCTVNSSAEVNGGVPFTFRRRSFSDPAIGRFTGGRGSVRVMAWEGISNVEIATTGPVTFSAIPSSPYDALGILCEGVAQTDSATSQQYRLSSVNPSNGAVGRVVPGDIVVVSASASGRATTKAGTYLVRHTLEANSGLSLFQMTLEAQTLPLNSGSGFAAIYFPVVVENTALQTSTLRVDQIPLIEGTPVFPPSGTLYLVRSTDTTSPLYITENLGVDYVAFNENTGVFTIDLATVVDFSGAAQPAAVLQGVEVGTPVAGFVRVPVRMDRAPERPLPRSLVAFESGISTAVGFAELTVQGTAPVVFTFSVDMVVGAPAAGEIGVTPATPISNAVFSSDPHAVVYEDVPGFIEFNLTALQWAAIHVGVVANALLPGDTLLTSNQGFRAQAGIFLEPSVPRPVLPLNGTEHRVVDAQHSVNPAVLGFRNAALFGEIEPELISFQVKRIRRFHKILQDAGKVLEPLRQIHQMRTAVVQSFGPGPAGFATSPYVVELNSVEPVGLTQAGVQPGDLLRVLGPDGVPLAVGKIAGVQDDTHLWIERDLSVDPVGHPVQIWLKTSPVPHEQSWEQLLERSTAPVLRRVADYQAQSGGFVEVENHPEDPRHLRDTDKNLDFRDQVLKGDVILVDPSGPVQGPGGIPPTGQEFGTRPFGDRAVPSRTTPNGFGEIPYRAGGPSELDDNRGFYWVTEVAQDALQVATSTTFSASPAEVPVTYGQNAYAVLPTITGSAAPFAVPPGGPGSEGQMDLRPTAFAGTEGSPANSFLGNKFSVAPMSYRVVRSRGVLSRESLELVLLMRERTKSTLEVFDVFSSGNKFGSYFVAQRDLHFEDLGNPLIPDEGKGVMSNALVDGVRGLTRFAPFCNAPDALAVLDRRFWVMDTRLDREFPAFQPGSPSYATLESNTGNQNSPVGDGRPVLPDRIFEVLSTRDQLRQSRWDWIVARAQRETGTWAKLARALANLDD